MCLGLFVWVEFVFTTRALTPLLRAWGSVGQCALHTPVHGGGTASKEQHWRGRPVLAMPLGRPLGSASPFLESRLKRVESAALCGPRTLARRSGRVENISELPVPSLSPSIFSNEVSTLVRDLLFHVRLNEALTCHDFLRACERPENKGRKKPGAKDVRGNVCCVI